MKASLNRAFSTLGSDRPCAGRCQDVERWHGIDPKPGDLAMGRLKVCESKLEGRTRKLCNTLR